MPKWLTPRRKTLLITAFISVLTYFTSRNVPSVEDFLSGNMTRIVEVTKMPAGALVAIIIILIGIFVYLWIDAGKSQEIERLISEIEGTNTRIDKLIEAIESDKRTKGNGET